MIYFLTDINGYSLRQTIQYIPQVFVNGEFIGGCDILINMHQSGELEKILKDI